MSVYTFNFEINQNIVKILEASRSRDQIMIHSCSKAFYAIGENKKFVKLIKRAVAEKNPTDRIVSTSIWAKNVIVRRIQMPVMTAAELKSAIRYEFEKHIPFPIDDCFYDYYVIRKLHSHERMEIMLVATKQNLVEERRRMLADGGWQLNYMDIHPFAISNAYMHFVGRGKQKPIALVHIAETENFRMKGPNFVCILKDGQPAVIRDLGDDIQASQNEQFAEESLERLGSVVHQSIEFYESSFDETVSELLISGHGAISNPILKSIEQETEMKPTAWGFLDKLQFESQVVKEYFEKNEAEYFVLVGLAIRGLKF